MSIDGVIEAFDDNSHDSVPTPLFAQAIETGEKFELIKQPTSTQYT